jgi:hypothetical protein
VTKKEDTGFLGSVSSGGEKMRHCAKRSGLTILSYRLVAGRQLKFFTLQHCCRPVFEIVGPIFPVLSVPLQC